MRTTVRLATSMVIFAALSAEARITRGPYLQLARPTEITVVFRTDTLATGRVRFGAVPGALSSTVTEPSASLVHVFRLSGLLPSTRYEYAIDLDGVEVAAGPGYRFRTYPTPGAQEVLRIFAWGDSGTGSSAQLGVANRLADQVGDATLSLILGDIIYPDGEPQDYDPKFFSPYAPLLKRMVIWPTIGNHDVHYDPAGGPYKDAFYLPANNPEQTELYYSFDYGDVHFTCLDTHVSGFGASSAQLKWAAADLAASRATWKIVYFHVPPFTGGTHSDSASVQSNILPVIEAGGADLVFSGHSHVYERTYLLRNKGIVQSDPNTYDKTSPTQGTLYVVSGTAGASGSLSDANHPKMAFQLGSVLGASVIDITGNTLHGYFLKSDGSSVDLFTLTKGADARGPSLIGVRAKSRTQIELSYDEPVEVGTGPGSATRLANYSITPGGPTITAAALSSDGRTVTLTTTSHAGGSYTLHVTGVRDRATPPNTAPVPTEGGYVIAGGPTVDAGTSTDAGQPVDAGAPDAGTTSMDAGLDQDAGVMMPLVTSLTPWNYLVGNASPPSGWAGLAFDDSLWSKGAQPLGFGETRIRTTVNMGGAVTLYARAEFDLTEPPETVDSLTLEVDFDDGFVAYLNGRELVRENVSAGQTFASNASASHESGSRRVYNFPRPSSLLVAGDNFLAVEVHNVNATSSDLLLEARLWVSATVPAADAGTPEEDAGQPPEDAGHSADDAGASFDDAGVSRDDAGASFDDAGVFVDGGSVDAGHPPRRPAVCGCSASEGLFALGALLLLVWRRRAA